MMKKGFMWMLLLTAAALAGAPQANNLRRAAAAGHEAAGSPGAVYAQEAQRRHSDDDEYTERDEFRQSYQLAPGAAVRVSGINGSVTVETSSGNTAEVYVLRSARTRADLEQRRVIVEQTAGGLVIRGENDKGEGRRGNDVRQRVELRLPRRIDFTASGINGRTTVGEVDGPVKISGVNGRVEVGQALGYTELSGINGSVGVTLAQVGERGIRVSGVNGSVELRFADALNADLSVSGINGAIDVNMPNLTIQGKVSRSSLSGRIGQGGAPVTVSGINGRVRLAPRG